MKNNEIRITIPVFHHSLFTIHGVGLSAFRPMLHALCTMLHALCTMLYHSLFTIHGVGLSAFRPMLHALCPMHYDSRFTIYDLRPFPTGVTL